MTLAQDVGIEELKAACEDYVVSTLSVTNACTYLAAVMEIQEKSTSKFIDIINITKMFRIHFYVKRHSQYIHTNIFKGTNIMSFYSAHLKIKFSIAKQFPYPVGCFCY